jgi:hypothetical protein
MTVHLNPEQEQLIGQAMRAGLIRDADEVVDVGVETLRKRLQAFESKSPMSAEEWSRQLGEWVRSHTTTTPLLSDEAISRDSIYGSRGM